MKPYGWGIVDKDGKAYFDNYESCVSEEYLIIECAISDVDEENPSSAPHRVVQLFYKEEEK